MENENIQATDVVTNEKKKKGKKKWIIIAVVLVLLVAIASSGSSEPTVEPIEGNSTTSSNSSTESTSAETTQDASKEIKPGSVVENDEVKISYKSCNTDFKNYSQYAEIKSGYKVIQAIFDFENISLADIILEGFQCYADGVKCDSFYYVDNYSDPWFQSISAGRKLTDATVYFEVPADTEIIELEYEADMWSGEKYIFIVE